MVDASSLDPREDEQYKEKLTPLQYEVTRNKATERAFTGAVSYTHLTLPTILLV